MAHNSQKPPKKHAQPAAHQAPPSGTSGSDANEVEAVRLANQVLDRVEKARRNYKRWSGAEPGNDPLRILAVEKELPAAELELEDATAAYEIARGDDHAHSRPSVRPTAPPPATPVQRSSAQDAAILTALKASGHAPRAIPRAAAGKAGVKAEIRKILGSGGMWSGSTVFDKAWERLSKSGEIGYA